jgi:hypothetical protein
VKRTRKSCYFLLMLFGLCAVAQQTKTVQDAVTPQKLAAYDAERAKLYEWANWQSLFGQWRIKTAGAGEFNFERQLDGKILTITNTQRLFASHTPKQADKYNSLIVIYVEGLTQRATFFDNEGNSFVYDVDTTTPNKITLLQPAKGAVSGSSITFAEKDGALVIEAATRPVAGAKEKSLTKGAVNTFTAEKVK